MPKRRPGGPVPRGDRRRRDRIPNVPPLVARDPASLDESSAEPAAPQAAPSRPLRPTLRAAAGAPRFARTQAPPLDLTAEYRFVARDLRQIGLLATLAFVVLGILAFVIH